MLSEEKTNTKNLNKIVDRFYSYVFHDFNGCWRWTNRLIEGYGNFWIGKTCYRAHVFSYLIHKGEVPEGLVLDHLCRIRDCVNPNHLEPKTIKENILCGEGIAAINSKKTHCKHGHEFTENNIYNYEEHRGNSVSDTRHCKICRERNSKKRNKTTISGTGQINKQKTECKNGHVFTEENTYTYKGKYGLARGCKLCRKANQKKFQEKI